MNAYTLFSGSRGNSALIVSKGINILIDVGTSLKKIEEKLLMSEGLGMEDINLILITHSHSDHIHSLYTIYNKYPHINILMDDALYLEVCEALSTKYKKQITLDKDRITFVNGALKGKKLLIENFPVLHDRHCLAWSIKEVIDDKQSLLFIPDNGSWAGWFKEIELIKFPYTYYFIESNYDETMQYLDNTRRTDVRRRALYSRGHSSNKDAMDKAVLFLETSNNENCKAIIFHHLSEECNTVDLARSFHEGYMDVWGKNTLFKGVKFYYATQDDILRIGEDYE